MKKMLVLASMMVMTISAAALPFSQAQKEALFLSDKMAYELGLTEGQYEMIYEINLDYFLSINTYKDIEGVWWARRNSDIRHILSTYQYRKYSNMNYFYRPLIWRNGKWNYPIYNKYNNHGHFYKNRPNGFGNYKGGNNKKGHYYYEHRGGNHGGPGNNHGGPGNNHGGPGGNHGNVGPGGNHGGPGGSGNKGGGPGNKGGGHGNKGGGHGNKGGGHKAK